LTSRPFDTASGQIFQDRNAIDPSKAVLDASPDRFLYEDTLNH